MSLTQTPSPSNTLFGRGQIFFDRFDANGTDHGQFYSLGNCDSFAISTTTDEVDMTDYTQETSAVYNSAIKKTTVALKISGFEISVKNLGILLLGDQTSYTQTAHTAAAQSETLVPTAITGLLGSFWRAPFRNVSAPTLVQGANTLVSGTDYEIFDAVAGVFRILPGGVTVVDSTVITYNYTAAAMTGATAQDVVRAANTVNIKGKLLFLGKPATGPKMEVLAFNVSLAPDGDFPLISDDFLKWSMKGTINSDAVGLYGGSSVNPFYQAMPR
jgi:hypothetical protein